jgi:ABC-type transport system involved in multi-copper enzyme maturation permease subunit
MKFSLLFCLIVSLTSLTIRAEQSNIDNDDDDDIQEEILGPGATEAARPRTAVSGNGKRLSFLLNPLYESNPNKSNWIKQTFNNMQHVPVEARENLNHQIYFNRLVGSKETYIDVYFEGDYLYITSCKAKLYFDVPYGTSDLPPINWRS